MKKFKIPFLSLLGVFLILVLAGCEKTGDDPVGNKAPDTRILSYSINSAAEKDTSGNPTTNYMVTVFWAGSDIDGEIKEYQYSSDGGTTWESAASTQQDFVFDFANAGATYQVHVKSIDNTDTPDPSAASVTIKRSYGAVETHLVDGPPNGAAVSTGVDYKVSATTATGTIAYISYKVDESGTWTDVAADSLGEAAIQLVGLSAGPHVIYFSGKRDDGTTDATPLAVSIVAYDGEFTPTIVNGSPVSDNGGWFSGVELTFSWSTVVDYYFGSLPAEAYSYGINDSTNYDNSGNPLASGWVSSTSTSFTPPAGKHVFFLKVRDSGGGISTMRLGFTAATPTFDEGILVVNGVDPATYGTELTDKLAIGAYWGDMAVSFYDIFGSSGSPHADITLPGNVTYIGGGDASVGPTVLAKYSTVVWLGNEYQGDWEVFMASPIIPYLTAGGNLVFASRYAPDFLPDAFAAWADIAWREGSAWGLGASSTIVEYKAVFPGLVDMNPPYTRTMTATSVFSGGGFLDSTDDGTVTNWDGTSGYTLSDLTTTLLFAHRSNAYDANSPFDYVRGLGVWGHPNFQFSSVDAGNEFPTPDTDEAKSNFILINGRHYGFGDLAALKANFSFILQNMCAEQ